ncbi:hypothetical protein L211DRAFT_229280 [Terfezia boudieri ATCC MYA-4762]|uniref:Uncharacterized protein n=1 Tax=Terfezia boudieri ATCC MYA-4762 TaxID=1051890 RepID=A0A3N4LLV0_9PEZI|nr:hypothetical protein L211DRAFT_229280 [Terfezia boudieri ATCC MYA-4762]
MPHVFGVWVIFVSYFPCCLLIMLLCFSSSQALVLIYPLHFCHRDIYNVALLSADPDTLFSYNSSTS